MTRYIIDAAIPSDMVRYYISKAEIVTADIQISQQVSIGDYPEGTPEFNERMQVVSDSLEAYVRNHPVFQENQSIVDSTWVFNSTNPGIGELRTYLRVTDTLIKITEEVDSNLHGEELDHVLAGRMGDAENKFKYSSSFNYSEIEALAVQPQ